MQDLGFLLSLGILVWLRKPKLTVVAGLVSLLLAVPLFHFWIFFTAERLTWYGAGFLLLSILQNLKVKNKK